MRPAPNRFAPKQRTLADIERDLDHWLICAQPAAFDTTTLADLQRRYSRLNPRLIEAKHNAAVQKRAAR